LRAHLILFVTLLLLTAGSLRANDTVNIGMNYPQTGPYLFIGIDEERGAQMALEEINETGGILGRRIHIIHRDSKSDADVSALNATELIEQNHVKMIFGGASSAVAIRVGGLCQKRGILFMATVTAANATTGLSAHRHTFRASYSAWMGAKALGLYLKKNFPVERNRYFFLVSDYSWGRSAEESIRRFSGVEDRMVYPTSYTRFPGETEQAFINKLKLAEIRKADVLVLCLFGAEMTRAVRVASALGLKGKMQIVVPILELSMLEGAGAAPMEGIVGTSDFNWKVPFFLKDKTGQVFVQRFADRYGRYPCWGAAKAYTILWEYKRAVERAKRFDAAAVIHSLEGTKFHLLKAEEVWRTFDHQDIQDVFLVKCKPEREVLKDRYQLDFFEIIDMLPGIEAARTHQEWVADRLRNGLPSHLEKLEGE
jgi:branched-chain amino acid transport system substrate-binding protein